MGKLGGFIEFHRKLPPRRPVDERVNDYREVYLPFPAEAVREQAARCMDCGIPFCHNGCPLGNLIPEWNDLVYKDDWEAAIARLHATNNFPEFTGRICPAPCEPACVLSINDDPVTIKQVEVSIVDRAWDEGWVQAHPPSHRTGRRVAVVGSGPAGLAAAQQLNRAGHWVTVYEKDDRIGGLLRYGIPDFKLEKWVVDRRLEQMSAEGVIFETNYDIGRDVTAEQLVQRFDAVVLCIGAMHPRDVAVPGRELDGVHFAMEYLPQQNKRVAGDLIPPSRAIHAAGKRVIILGGGDTGADCLGNVHREKCASVHQFEVLPPPPDERAADNPWPTWPVIMRTSTAHEEGGVRDYSIQTTAFSGRDGRVEKLHAIRVESRVVDGRPQFVPVDGSEFTIDCDLVLIAAGFLHPVREGLVADLGVELDPRGNVRTDVAMMSSVPGVFAAGDSRRGASLVVWAIAEGRQAARGVDEYLMGSTRLPESLRSIA
ncbi:MAG TPA: glutamate synthase subunit beta [Candidatus Dormibacteraeota bacterium]|nr:glutamate synthase subunit beta [Candidatus Dormibacteraeota bacterium]